jgi:hypothetical protein
MSGFSVVYHIATMNHWQQVVAEQVKVLLHNSGITALHVSLTGKDPQAEKYVRSLLPNISSVTRGLLSECEHTAMNVIDGEAACAKRPILYFHTKGVSKFSGVSEHWRHYMNEFVFEADKWADFLSTSSVYNACGRMLLHDPRGRGYKFFAGNFWMARSDYLRSLGPYKDFVPYPAVGNRHYAEVAVNRTLQMRPYATDGTLLAPDDFGTFVSGVTLRKPSGDRPILEFIPVKRGLGIGFAGQLYMQWRGPGR